MSAPRKTSTPALVSALRILAAEIQSPDGVANMTIAEGADRIEELAARDIAAALDESHTLRARVAELEGIIAAALKAAPVGYVPAHTAERLPEIVAELVDNHVVAERRAEELARELDKIFTRAESDTPKGGAE